jgi:hypothetical protein
MKLKRAPFYILRLKNASLPELVYRAKEALFVRQLEGLLKRGVDPVCVPAIDSSDIESLKLPSFQHDVDEDRIERMLGGEVFTLNEESSVIREFERSHSDVFARIKSTNASPDVRAVWEPARLQHLASLLALCAEGRKREKHDKIKAFVKHALLEWIETNPFLLGPHYMSAMECGLRIPVFFYSLKCLDNLDAREHRLILETMYLHAWWVSKRLSLYSSLGNHTIAESIGLIFAGAVFRKTRQGKGFLEKGVDLLRSELNHQILYDGGPVEQSLSYHRFVLDLYWLAVDFLEKNNLDDCTDVIPRLKQGEDFLRAFEDNSGCMPAIGDSDDGHAIAPGVYPKRIKLNAAKHRLYVFKHAGYTVIRLENGTPLTFDHGPIGMSPLYNHGHADALSITLRKNGKALLVDPGTYRYNGSPKYRRYFKGTRAHNTVTIDGLDQAVQETGFLWGKPYKTKLIQAIEGNDGVLLEAVHNGYSRLKEPVWHKRSVLLFDKMCFLIKDSFSGEGVHDFELNYHLHPDVSLTKEDDQWVIDNEGAQVFLTLLGGHDFVVVTGQKNPLLGWYSPAYGIKKEAGVLHCTETGPASDVQFITAIRTESAENMRYLQEAASTL